MKIWTSERQQKREKMEEYQYIYGIVRQRVYDLSRGKTFKDLRRLQKCVKNCLKLGTKRVDWRTKEGIILWFCENWEVISQNMDKIKRIRNRLAPKTNKTPRKSEEFISKSPMNDYQYISVGQEFDVFSSFEDCEL